jgi:hypothetical protein
MRELYNEDPANRVGLESCPSAPPGAHDPDHWTRPVRHCVRDVFHRPCSPRAGPFPPPPPPPVPRACSAASQVVRACLTSRDRASRDYRLSVPLAARPTLVCHPANHPGRGITNNQRATTRSLGSRAWSLSYVPGISDRAGPTSDSHNAASSLAFRHGDDVGTLESMWFRGSISPARTPSVNASLRPCGSPTQQRAAVGQRLDAVHDLAQPLGAPPGRPHDAEPEQVKAVVYVSDVRFLGRERQSASAPA